jgi:hypothetical protein
VTALLIWLALFGLYPLAEPEHAVGVLGWVDVAVHALAAAELAARYLAARRAREAARRAYRPLP